MLEDPALDASARAGAAFALAPSLDKAGRRRVLAAAETSVSPELRAALTAIATNDECVAARLGLLPTA